jgi:hypothetical protein
MITDFVPAFGSNLVQQRLTQHRQWIGIAEELKVGPIGIQRPASARQSNSYWRTLGQSSKKGVRDAGPFLSWQAWPFWCGMERFWEGHDWERFREPASYVTRSLHQNSEESSGLIPEKVHSNLGSSW